MSRNAEVPVSFWDKQVYYDQFKLPYKVDNMPVSLLGDTFRVTDPKVADLYDCLLSQIKRISRDNGPSGVLWTSDDFQIDYGAEPDDRATISIFTPSGESLVHTVTARIHPYNPPKIQLLKIGEEEDFSATTFYHAVPHMGKDLLHPEAPKIQGFNQRIAEGLMELSGMLEIISEAGMI